MDDRTDVYKKRLLAYLMAAPESQLDSATITLISAFQFMANELQDARQKSAGRNMLILDARHTIAIDTILDAFGTGRG